MPSDAYLLTHQSNTMPSNVRCRCHLIPSDLPNHYRYTGVCRVSPSRGQYGWEVVCRQCLLMVFHPSSLLFGSRHFSLPFHSGIYSDGDQKRKWVRHI